MSVKCFVFAICAILVSMQEQKRHICTLHSKALPRQATDSKLLQLHQSGLCSELIESTMTLAQRPRYTDVKIPAVDAYVLFQ